MFASSCKRDIIQTDTTVCKQKCSRCQSVGGGW